MRPRHPRSERPTRPCRGLLAAAVVLLVVVAGCTGTLAEYTASPATIPDSAVEGQGYVHGNTTEVPVTYPVGAAGVTRNVTARTWVSGYSKTTAEDDVAALVLYSSPNVVVEGRSLNPMAQLSNRGLVDAVLERVDDLSVLGGVDDVSDLRAVDSRAVTVLGEPTEMVTYAGVADVDGERVAVLVHVTVVEHGDDVVVALGVHDEAMDETDAQAALVERIEHAG